MRCILKATIPVEAGNAAISSGRIKEVLGGILDGLKPEAAYFYPEGGQRAVLLVVDLKDPAEIPAAAEPFFLGLNAQVTITPCMNVEDLQRGLGGLEDVLQKLTPAAAG